MNTETASNFKIVLNEIDQFLEHHILIEIGIFILLVGFGIFFFTRGWKPVWNFIKKLITGKLGIDIDEEKDTEKLEQQSSFSDDISIDEIMLTIDEIDSRVAQIKDEIQRILKNLSDLHYLSKQYEKNSSDILQKCEQIQTELSHIKEISEKNHSNISDKITNFEKLIENNFRLIGKDIENLQKDLSSVEDEVRKLRDILVLKGYIKKEESQGKL